ncbi:MAG: flotillin [Caudoviricetes sp.]|nr:MAG: flotillin [Caudoviricetes sp.]
MGTVLLKVAMVIIILAAVFIIGAVLYKKAPPNTAMVITGPTGCKTAIGKGCFVIPIIQRVDYMSLENIQSDFTSRDEIPTKDAINILVDAVANVSISQDPEGLKIAASKFLGYKPSQIREIITPIFEGNTREIISQMELKELIQGDKKVLAEKIIDNVIPNLKDMGLTLTTFNIQNFKDKNGVIDNLGIENTVQIRKDAAISKAKAEQEIAIAEAEADRQANEAQVNSDLEIAKRQNELEIRRAELKRQSDIKKAEADAAYSIQEQEQRKSIEIANANANLARQEKEIELKEREVEIKERALEADIKKVAEAQKFAEQQRADAELYERTRRAEAEKVEAENRKIAMENEAEGIRAKGEAEAAAIKAKALAEAEGTLKKAEAMQKYGEAAQMDLQLEAIKLYFEQLPKIAEAAGKAYTNVDKIIMYGDNSAKLTENIMNTVTQVSEGLSESMGLDLKSLLSTVLGVKLANNNNANSEKAESSSSDIIDSILDDDWDI